LPAHSPDLSRPAQVLTAATQAVEALVRDSRRVLVLGIGGGGDVVGALASALLCERLGTPALLGGMSWERRPIDPEPGPRSAAEILDARPLAPGVMLAGPETRTAGGALFAESHMARLRDEPTVLVDPGPGPERVAKSLATACAELDADLVLLVDVGGDVLGDGSEPGLASPLCDAVMLAAGVHLQRGGHRVAAAVFGAACDGELTIEELLDRLARVAGAGGLLGAEGMSPAVADKLERACLEIPTEASALAVRCARGELGLASIRGGRRQVTLTPLGAMTFYIDPSIAVSSVARLAEAVLAAGSLQHANEVLRTLGVRTELDYELNAAQG
jgi:hypothetical protein